MKKFICKDTGEIVFGYDNYLLTKHWQLKKAAYRNSKLIQKCYVCGNASNIHIHHKTYKHVGNERLCDLIPLCANCHFPVHDFLKYRKEIGATRTNLHNAAKKYKKTVTKRLRNQKLNP